MVPPAGCSVAYLNLRPFGPRLDGRRRLFITGYCGDISGHTAIRLSLSQQRMPLRQLVRIPGCKPMPNSLLADLVFRHRRNHLVVH